MTLEETERRMVFDHAITSTKNIATEYIEKGDELPCGWAFVFSEEHRCGEPMLVLNSDILRALLVERDAYGVLLISEGTARTGGKDDDYDEIRQTQKGQDCLVITWEYQKDSGTCMAYLSGEEGSRKVGDWECSKRGGGGQLQELLPGARGN